MKIEVNDDTAAEVQAMLARRGETPDVESYVQRTLSKRLLFETVAEVRDSTKDVPAAEIEAAIEEAVTETRQQRRIQSPDADRT